MKKNSVRFNAIFWGLALIIAAVVLILDGAGVDLGYGINAWRILLGCAFVAWLVCEIVRLRIYGIFFPLAFLFITFEAPIAEAVGREDHDLISNWVVLSAAFLLTIAFYVIIPKNGKNFKADKIGSSTLYFDSADLFDAHVSDNVSKVDVYFTNREAYQGNGNLSISDNVGQVNVNVPREWRVSTKVHDNIGRVKVPDQDDAVKSKSLTLEISDNVGSVNVIFVD